MKKTDQIVLGKSFAVAGIPGRSAPMQYVAEVKAIADTLPAGRAVELNAELLSEHTVRKYLAILAEKDPSYREFVVRTASSTSATGRRRLFIAKLGGASVAASNGDQASETEIQR